MTKDKKTDEEQEQPKLPPLKVDIGGELVTEGMKPLRMKKLSIRKDTKKK